MIMIFTVVQESMLDVKCQKWELASFLYLHRSEYSEDCNFCFQNNLSWMGLKGKWQLSIIKTAFELL
jgi:hypothetical protein